MVSLTQQLSYKVFPQVKTISIISVYGTSPNRALGKSFSSTKITPQKLVNP
jgi:hypothetical protein